MMRPLTAVGVYRIRPSLYPAKLPCPGGERQERRPSFPGTRPNFAGGRSRLDFLLLLFLCQDKKRRRTRASLSRVKTREGEEQGLCPFTPTFFSSLDGRKEGKRRSRRQGRRPIWPGTLCTYGAVVRGWNLRLTTRPLGRNYRGQSPLTTAPEWAHNYLRPTGRYMISSFIMRNASSGLTALSSPIEAKM